MAKFKVGDRVIVTKGYDFAKPYLNKIGVIYDTISIGYLLQIDGVKLTIYFVDEMLELVEPEKEFSIHGKILSYGEHYYIRREDNSFCELGKLNTYKDDGFQAIMTFMPVENQLHLPLSRIHRLYTRKEMAEQITKDRIKKAFERKPIFFMDKEFPYYHFSLTDDALDAFKYGITPELAKRLDSIRTPIKPEPPKNRIPDRVVFNQDKGKVTVLISKFNDGEAPYRAYTSKVHGDDEYSGYFGFFLSYYKYLNRHLDGATRKELIDMAFEQGENKDLILEGAVSQEAMRLLKIDEWDNILTAILEVSKQNKGYWDYAEWKEMLRVHELETKREKQREVQKEIKKHQKEIDRLKKEV